MPSEQVAHFTPDRSSSNCYIGTVLKQGFQIKSLVGKGLVGEVYSAVHTQFPQELFAIKFLSEKIRDQESNRRFVREIKISAELSKRSSHIVNVKAYGLHKETIPYYVMEFLEGTTLAFLLKKLAAPLDLQRFLSLSLQIAKTLKIAHQGIYIKGHYYPVLHRNLEPSNIFILSDEQGKEFVKVLDYGMAKLLGYEAQLTKTTGQILGILSYTSPEQIQGEALDHRSDLYSFGILMYQMLSGRLPWDLKQGGVHRNNFSLWYQIHCVDPPLPFDPSLNLPPALETMVMDCLAKDPRNRPLRIAEIIKVLETVEKATICQPQGKKTQGLQTHGCDITWPADKPIAKIIFPKTIETPTGKQLGLWIMLESSEIDRLDIDSFTTLQTAAQSSFLFVNSPYPLIAWLVALPEVGEVKPRFFHCFLDLQRNSTTRILNFLLKQKLFKVIVFASDALQRPQFVLDCSVSQTHLNALQVFMNEAQGQLCTGTLAEAKANLRLQIQSLSAPESIVLKSESTVMSHLERSNSDKLRISTIKSGDSTINSTIVNPIFKPFYQWIKLLLSDFSRIHKI